jgi:hypothetical protein
MTNSIYAERRARVAAQLGKGGIAVIPLRLARATATAISLFATTAISTISAALPSPMPGW